jgi:hypothetical protein
MSHFDTYFLMKTEDIELYVKEKLSFFEYHSIGEDLSI